MDVSVGVGFESVKLRRGDSVSLSVAAANRDHRVFGGPLNSMRRAHEFSPTRSPEELRKALFPESIFLHSILEIVGKQYAREASSPCADLLTDDSCPADVVTANVPDRPSIMADLSTLPKASSRVENRQPFP
jgi:hypothetical protein